MRLSGFYKSHSLHDCPINALRYCPEQGELTLDVDICDDGQWSFLKGAIGLYDVCPISFVFTGVSSYSISPDPLDFATDEINSIRIISSEQPGKEIIEFLLLSVPGKGVKFLQIEAENVDWTEV